jgi:hypothetical protein
MKKEIFIKLLTRIPTDTINKVTSYFLVAFLWAPHAARECATELCNGPYFISPMIGTFLMPNWVMDMSLRGWMLQLLFAPPLLLLLYVLFRLEKNKHFTFLKIYAIRWTIMWYGIVLYYNLVFWVGLREYMLPLFTFTM